jgi:hypothetical protein
MMTGVGSVSRLFAFSGLCAASDTRNNPVYRVRRGSFSSAHTGPVPTKSPKLSFVIFRKRPLELATLVRDKTMLGYHD